MQYIFIIGAGRSGTKFLRDILGASNDIVTVPYDIGYIWRYGNEHHPNDELSFNMVTNDISSYIKKTLPSLVPDKITSNSTFLLEKSVPNTLRVEFLNTIYPSAKFIHLIRDGRAVTESSFRMWGASPNPEYLLKKIRYFPWSNYRYALWYAANFIKGKISSKRGQHIWGPRYRGIDYDLTRIPLEQVCARQWRRSVETATSQLSKLNKNQVLEIRYETLMQDPKSLESICTFIGTKNSSSIIQKFKDHALPYNVDKWRENIDGFDLSTAMPELEPLLEKLGYID